MKADEEWKLEGICREDPDLWDTDTRAPGSAPDLAYLERTRWAKEACARCPVVTPCLEYALVNREAFGIWGGQDPQDRSRMIKRRQRQALRDNSQR